MKMAKMTVYHGEYSEIKKPEIIKGSNTKDIGKAYKRLICEIAEKKQISAVDALFEAYNSFVSDKIDDYNSSFYYDSPQNIFNAFITGII